MNFFLLLDLPRRYQICFQDPITPVMSAVIDLNTYISAFLILILIFVAFQILDVLIFFRVDVNFGLISQALFNKDSPDPFKAFSYDIFKSRTV
jgi:hypothetical protein